MRVPVNAAKRARGEAADQKRDAEATEATPLRKHRKPTAAGPKAVRAKKPTSTARG